MKKITKILLCAAFMLVGAGCVIGTGINPFAYAAYPAFVQFASQKYSLTKVPSTGIVGERVYIPTLKDNTNHTVANSIFILKRGSVALGQLGADPGAARLTDTVYLDNDGEGENGYFFIPSQSATTYYLQYFTAENSKAKTPRFTIRVTDPANYTTSFAENSEIILPTVVEVDASKKIAIPYPIVKYGDTTIVSETGVVAEGYSLVIDIIAGDVVTYNNELAADAGNNKKLTKNTDGYYEFVAGQGNNVIKYSLKKGTAKVYSIAQKTVVCDAGYDADTIKLSVTVSNLPTTSGSSLGDRVSLPYPTVSNSKNPTYTVSFFASAKVLFSATEKGTYTEITTANYVKQDDDGLYFTPTEKGWYKFTFTAKDFYGNTESYTTTSPIQITDRKAPSIVLTNSYAASADTSESAVTFGFHKDTLASLDSASYLIPYRISKTSVPAITFPALFAYDSFDGVVGNAKLTRKITGTIGDTTININLNDAKYHFQAYVNDATPPTFVAGTYEKAILTTENVFVKYADEQDETAGEGRKFVWLVKEVYRNMYEVTVSTNDIFGTETTAGSVKVTYSAYDTVGNTKEFDGRTITLGDYAATTKITPNSTLPSSIKDGQEVGFTASFSDTYDQDIQKLAYVQSTSGETVVTKNGTYNNMVAIDFDGTTFSFTADDTMNISGKVKILIVAANDAANGNPTLRESILKEIAFVDVVADTTAPSVNEAIDLGGDARNTYKQRATLYVDGPLFTDADAELQTGVIVEDIDGNIVNGYTMLGNSLNDGISFVANRAVVYYVTYWAKDSAGNFTFVTVSTAEAIKRVALAGTITKTADMTIQLGTEKDLGDLTATDDEGNDLQVKVVCESNPGMIKGYKLVADRLSGTDNTFVVKYVVVLNGEDTVVHTFNVTIVDTTAPAINIAEVGYETVRKEIPNTNETTGANVYDKKIFLPDFNPEDSSSLDMEISDIGIASKSLVVVCGSNKFTVDSTDESYKLVYFAAGSAPAGSPYDSGYYFIPKKVGTYTATYSATDLNGNSATPAVITIQFSADTQKPVITLTNESSLDFSKYLNETFTLDISKISVTDNIDTSLSYSSLVVYKGTESNSITPTVDGNNYTYSFDSTGEYTLLIKATDSNGNVGTYSKTITVSEKSGETIEKSEIVGIILIVVSVIILAGIVIYFVRTRRKAK